MPKTLMLTLHVGARQDVPVTLVNERRLHPGVYYERVDAKVSPSDKSQLTFQSTAL